jgi:hypothetical protein
VVPLPGVHEGARRSSARPDVHFYEHRRGPFRCLARNVR